MKQLSKSLLAGIGALTIALSPALAATQWDMPNEYPATSIHGEGDAFFAKVLQEKSGGEIEIVHHFGGALGYKSKDQLDAVGDGAVPIADTFSAPLGGIEPLFQLSSLPFLAVTPTEARQLYEAAKPYYDKVFARFNQKLLYTSPWPPSGLWGQQPLDSLAALENVKIRTYDVYGTETLRAAGAAPIQLSWADVVPQLGTGGIQAVLTSAEAGISAKFGEHLSHFTEINYASPLNMVTINLDTWNDLSAELQAAVLEAAQAAEEHTWQAMVDRVEQNYQDAQASHITVVKEVSQDYLNRLGELAAPSLNEWLKKMGPDGEAIIAEYHRRIGKDD